MKRSVDRILVTHVGSLPRPKVLIENMLSADRGSPFSQGDYEAFLSKSVSDLVKKQVELGVDIVDDGEFSKRGFAVYAHERLGGLSPTGHQP